MITCKFVCVDIKDTGPHSPKEVTFSTQYDPGLPDDQRFTKATPWGKMIVSIDNPAALAQLAIGKFYYLDIRPI